MAKGQSKKHEGRDNLVKGALIAGAVGAAALAAKKINEDHPEIKDQIREKAEELRDRIEGEVEDAEKKAGNKRGA